jgi:sulfite reductase (NADPH) flavoprotein alpha-component
MYSKENPFISSIKERYCLSSPEAEKKTYHVVCDLADSGIKYRVGDSFGFFPENAVEDVEKIIEVLESSPDVEVEDRRGNIHTLREFLLHGANLADVSKKLYEKVYKETAPEGFLANRHLLDFLEEAPNRITAKELAPFLMPLLPRFYSVASSQALVGDEVHFTVADVEYETNGRKRHGVGSLQLCHRLGVGEKSLKLFLQSAHAFSLTDNDQAKVIMIGPGTGVAPFRAFMQERHARNSTGQSWLFFGERHEKHNYYYRDEWGELVEKNKLRLSLAFSRDQSEKVYVQDKMLEEGDELYSWIEQGAYIYVCGDAKEMAKAVESALLTLIERGASCSHQEAKEKIKEMRKERRYLRDVY